MYKVLIADDEQIERSTIRLILNKGIDNGLEIYEAVNGRQACAEAAEQKPDIIFMDIKMPGFNGLEAAREIRELDPDVIFVFITAFNEFEFAHEAIRIGVEDYLIKPVSENVVIEVTRKIIDKLDALKKERIFNRDTHLKLNTLGEYLQNEFLFHLFIRGMDNGKFVEYLSVLGFKFAGGQAAALRIDYGSYPIPVGSDYQRTVLAKRCGNLVASACGEQGLRSLFNYELSAPFFLLLVPESDEAETAPPLSPELISFLEAEVKMRLNISLSIHPGTLFMDAREAPASYSRAMSAGKKETTETSSPDLPSADEPLQLADRIKQSLLLDDRDSLRDAGDELAAWMNSYHDRPELVSQRVRELFAVLRHFLRTRQIENRPLPESPSLSPESNIDEMRGEARNFLNAVFEYSRGGPPAMVIGPALKYIRTHYAEDLSLDDMAERTRLSPSYFSRLFKKVMGMSFVDFLTDIRMEHARIMLESEVRGIAEIAESCGFRDANYFTRVFHKMTGMSPRDYRRQLFKGQKINGSAE